MYGCRWMARGWIAQFVPLAAGGSDAIVLTLLVPSPAAPATGAGQHLGGKLDDSSGTGQANPSNLVYDLADARHPQGGQRQGRCPELRPCERDLGRRRSGIERENEGQDAEAGHGRCETDRTGRFMSPQNKKCFVSTVSIVDTMGCRPVRSQADPLAIDLFRPVADLNKGAKFETRVLLYKRDGACRVPIPKCISSRHWLADPWLHFRRLLRIDRCFVPLQACE